MFFAYLTFLLFLTWPVHFISVGLTMLLLSAERKGSWNCSMCSEGSFHYTFPLFSVVNCSQSQFELGSPFSKPPLFILLSITNKMQRYTVFLIAVNVLHVSGGFSTHHHELKIVHTASGISQACLLLPLAWVSSKSPTLAVAASKYDIYQTLCVQFWAPDDGRRNRLKHVEHWHQ